MTIPNLITAFRVVLVPVVIMLILREEWAWAFALTALAGISDGLDGFIARRFGMCSSLGEVIDPLADKILVVAIYCTLAIIGIIPVWLALVVILRDVMLVMAIAVSWMMAQPIETKSLFVSKVTTALQIAFVAFVLGGLAFALEIGGFVEPFAIIVAFFTVMTAILYGLRWHQQPGN